MPQLLTQAEYARYRAEKGLRGQTPAAVNKAVKAGRLSLASGALVNDGGRVLVNPELADAEWAGNTDPAMQRAKPPGPDQVRPPSEDGQAKATGTLNMFRAQTEASKAVKAKVEADQLLGTVLVREHVENAAFEAMRIARDQFRVMPSKLAQRLAYETTPEGCRRILEAEIKAILNDLSRRFTDLGNPGPNPGAGDKPPA
jgi:stage V sporulation protein SpoVS